MSGEAGVPPAELDLGSKLPYSEEGVDDTAHKANSGSASDKTDSSPEAENNSREQQFLDLVVGSRRLIEKGLNGGVFDKDQKVIAESAFQNPNNTRALLGSLALVDAHTSDDPEWNATVKDNIARIKRFVRISENGTDKTILELEAERDSTPYPERKAEIERLLAEGEYVPEFPVKADSDQESESRQDKQLTDEELPAATKQVLAKVRKEIHDSDMPESEKKELIATIDEVGTLPKEVTKQLRKEFNKGDLTGAATVGGLRLLRGRMQALGRDTSEIDALILRSNDIEMRDLNKLDERLKIMREGPEQRMLIREWVQEGRTEEFLGWIRSHPDADMVNMVFGTKFKSNQEAKDHLDKIMINPTELEKLKKRAGRVGLLAALILIGGGLVGNVSKEAIGVQQ